VILHESYNASVSWNNDIALLRVKPNQNRGMRFGPYVQPLCLPPMNVPYTTDTPCAVYGWGATKKNPFVAGVFKKNSKKKKSFEKRVSLMIFKIYRWRSA
jgi:hypothetical protein